MEWSTVLLLLCISLQSRTVTVTNYIYSLSKIRRLCCLIRRLTSLPISGDFRQCLTIWQALHESQISCSFQPSLWKPNDCGSVFSVQTLRERQQIFLLWKNPWHLWVWEERILLKISIHPGETCFFLMWLYIMHEDKLYFGAKVTPEG